MLALIWGLVLKWKQKYVFAMLGAENFIFTPFLSLSGCRRKTLTVGIEKLKELK